MSVPLLLRVEHRRGKKGTLWHWLLRCHSGSMPFIVRTRERSSTEFCSIAGANFCQAKGSDRPGSQIKTILKITLLGLIDFNFVIKKFVLPCERKLTLILPTWCKETIRDRHFPTQREAYCRRIAQAFGVLQPHLSGELRCVCQDIGGVCQFVPPIRVGNCAHGLVTNGGLKPVRGRLVHHCARTPAIVRRYALWHSCSRFAPVCG